ncbi:PREDICTED: translin-like [Tarenaya hassleriana]|uniref:translin-like n=1 Tax=Tarenaya hassleriana TaxID=28532 RepID=UPI00053C925B|nr:PREDICTED: translin-like [Tarenaya hassleriana]
MKSTFRNAHFSVSRLINPNPCISSPIPRVIPLFSGGIHQSSIIRRRDPSLPSLSTAFCSSSSSIPMAGGEGQVPPRSSPSLEKQFEEFRVQLEGSASLRERIRAVVMEIESATRLIQANLLLVHQLRPVSEVLEKAKEKIGALKDLYSQLSEVLRDCSGQYYRYHGDWRSETQTVVSQLAFMHWLETGTLLAHIEAEEKLGLNSSEFGLDTEDYLVGVCFMSNDMPRYVVNRVTAGDYDCPRKVLNFLTDLHAAFRMLNLRNDFLRKKFDSMKYDLRRVEEVYYDVKIRGLAPHGESDGTQGTQG